MSKKRKKNISLGILLLLAVAAAVAGLKLYRQKQKTQSQPVKTYKEEMVRRGTVLSGISENGTVEFGTSEQTFSVAEVTEVASASSESASTSQEVAGQGGMSGENAGAGGQNGFSVTGGTPQSGTGQMTAGSSGSSSSSEETTSLEVETVYVSAGQVVEKGDKILKITEESISEYRAQLEAAAAAARLSVSQEEINVESKRAEAEYTYQLYLAKGEIAEETYNATVTSLENEVEELEEDLAESAVDLAELQAELDAGYDVEDDLEEEQLNYSSIEANLRIAENNLSTQSLEAKQTYENDMTNYKYADQLYEIDTNGLEDDLNDARDTLEEAEENLQDFENQIGEGIVYAEYAGTVMEVAYESGDSIVNEATLVTYTDPEQVTINVSVSQEDISQVSIGDTAGITLTAYSGEEFEGEVSGISTSSSAGSSTVNYGVEVRFTGDISKVYSGMTGEVIFAGKTVEDTLYVSNRAVHQDGARSYVRVLEEDGTVRECDVKTGFSNGSIVAVESGLEEGQTVLIESQVTQ